MKQNPLLITGIAMLAGACAHHKDVRAGADGVHRVVVQTEDTEAGARNAIRQANHFCEERGLTAAFVEEDKKYTGDMDEKDYKTAKRVSKAAQAVGGAVWVFGGRAERNAGGLVGLGGAVADQAIGKGYTVEMKFKCQ
ncbi:MAG TPA: hypothetical protein VFV50_12670 [Bdellovibrionales bacterium]|nr:hypothetical protein [Bdellovibrionales bacterium]